MCGCCKRESVEAATQNPMALLAAGANACAVDKCCQTALHFAAENDLASLVSPLIAAGARLEAKVGRYGTTALLYACANGHEDTALALLAAGANARAVDGERRTALHWAARKGLASLVPRLLAAGVELELAAEDFGSTALLDACDNCYEEVALALLAAGASAHVPRHDGYTALHFAARKGLASAVTPLLEAGAQLEATAGNDSNTPLMEARDYGHHDVAVVLLAAAAAARAQGGAA